MNDNQKQPPKQVIVVRKDLNMRKGKIAAQVAHASMKVLLDLMQIDRLMWHTQRILSVEKDSSLDQWLEGKFTKICVSVDSEEELLDIYKKASDNGLLCSLIQDAGLTEFGGVPTYTTCAIGPDYPEVIDLLTGQLKLL